MPDEIVRKHPLMREAHRRGLFDPDAPENIALLAEREVKGVAPAKVPGLSEGLPRHQGAHPVYSRQVADAANDVMNRLMRKHEALDEIPDEILMEAAVEVCQESWEILKNWKGSRLE